jgi:hypothetical protein
VTVFRSRIAPALGVGLTVLAIYLLTASGHVTGQDQEYFYRTARSLARDGSFAIEPIKLNDVELAGARGRDGRFYSQYAPGLSVAMAPLVCLADKLRPPIAQVLPHYRWPFDNVGDIAPRMFTSYFNIPVSALTAALLTFAALQLGYSRGLSIFLGLAYALSSFAWGQSRILFAEPLQTLLLMSAVVMLLGKRRSKYALAGGAIAAATLVKLTSLIACPAFLLWPDENGEPLYPPPAGAAAFLLPPMLALSLYAFHNWTRFGNVVATGYTLRSGNLNFDVQPFGGLLGLFFSAGRGLFWFAPLTIVTLFAIKRFYHEQTRVARPLLLLSAMWLLFHAFYQFWHAGWGWGPRYLLPILPFLYLPLASAWQSLGQRIVVIVVGLLGFLIQLPGALVDFIDSGQDGIRLFRETCTDCSAEALHTFWAFRIPGSELVRHSTLLLNGKIDIAWLTFAQTSVSPMTFVVAGFFALAGAAFFVSLFLGRRNIALT